MPDPRTPCVVGVGSRTWHPNTTGAAGAPEPLEMWELVTRAAEADAGVALLDQLDSIDIVYCQTWQYDAPVDRLCDQLGIAPRRRVYSGIGGTTPQVLVQEAAARIVRGELDVALVVGAEALDTQRRFRKAGERYPYSFKPPEKSSFPWEAPFHPAEVAHDVFQAWLTFALFDNARRAWLGTDLAAYRQALGSQWHRFTQVAARNPEAWFPLERTAEEIITPTPANRLVGYPYTKYMISIMDVDMAAAVVLMSDERANALGIVQEQRVYLRGWHYATDPIYVAAHPDLASSPAMCEVTTKALGSAGVGIDDVAHLDLYSCFGSSVNFMRDALRIGATDVRPLTVTGGLPYHGGAGSDYLTHAIAEMVRVLRVEPGAYGLVTGVGMHMTKHVAGVYCSNPGPIPSPDDSVTPTPAAAATVAIVDRYEGEAAVAAYSVVHGPDGTPEWGLAVCDVPGGGRCYARIELPELLIEAETVEWVGRTVRIRSSAERDDLNLVEA